MLLPSGVFWLEYWDENKKANIPHLGLTVNVRDPNHAVWSIQLFMNKWELYNKLLTVTTCNNSSDTLCHMQVVLLKRFGRYGKFTFKSHASGQHFLCMQSNSTRFSVFAGDRLVSWNAMASYIEFNMLKMSASSYFSIYVQKVHLDVQMGEHTIDPNAAKAKDTIKAMEYNLQHLIDQMRYISRQLNFQRVGKHRQGGLTTKCNHINCLPG